MSELAWQLAEELVVVDAVLVDVVVEIVAGDVVGELYLELAQKPWRQLVNHRGTSGYGQGD